MPDNAVHAQSVPQNFSSDQSFNGGANRVTRPLREYRRVNSQLQHGEPFNPFQLFDGAIVPTQILRCPVLLPSEKLVFARLTQFAGAKGKAWPSLERLAAEVALSVPQTRRCVRSLEDHGFIRRLSRSGRSNEFAFLWHRLYERGDDVSDSPSLVPPQSPVSALPQSSAIAPPQSPMTAAALSSTIGGPITHDHPGRSPVIARRESLKSSSEQNHVERNQGDQKVALPKPPGTWHSLAEFMPFAFVGDDENAKKQRLADTDPETEFLLRLRERHRDALNGTAVLQSVQEELAWDAEYFRSFLDFEAKQTTAPEKLTNPAGHYRASARKFRAASAKQRESERKERRRTLELSLEQQAYRAGSKPQCPLSRCGGTGEVWNEEGFASACSCSIGARLKPEVLALLETLNQRRRGSK